MAETEEYFPRGGKKPSVLFKKSANFLGAPEKTEKKKKKPKKKSEGDDGYLSDDETREIDISAKNCAIGLSYKTIKKGVLVLGRVKQVLETKVVVMLPCRMIGNIMACHISEPYNKLLDAYVNDQTEKVCELSSMFRVGQYVAVKVLEVHGQGLMLTTMPHHVNGEKQHADIVKGAIFQAAVSSIEDHGYVMDIGIANTRTFLPKNETNPQLDLDVGMVTWCAIKSTSSDSSIVTLSTTLNNLQVGVLKHKQNTTLLPGSNVEFVVDTPLDNGIEGTIFGDVTCYIQRQHVDKVKGKKPALGQKIRARVLYVMPTRKCPFLTMKNIFESTYPDLGAEQKYKDGDIIENAQVLKIIGRSVHLKLGRGSTGLISLRRLQVDEDLTDEDIVAKSYPIGSNHKVRVLCYNLSDYTYSVTDSTETLTERYFSVSDLTPGDIVRATVKSVNDKVVEVTVGRVRGFVPLTHLTETGLYVDPKKARTSKLPQKKYKVGQSVTARVLSVEAARQSVALTLKPSLLTPDLLVLKSYHDVQIGKSYTGVVRVIRDYILVSFFNNVTAYIPSCFIPQDARKNVTDAFHIGQIVTCTAVDVKPDEKKMSASLITAPFVNDENYVPKRLKRKQNDEDDTEPKRKKNKEENEDTTQESEPITKKKKKSKHEPEETQETETQPKKKKRNDTESSQENAAEDTHKVNKKKNCVSEESDAIETDIYEEEELLTPQEQGLLDMSDCSTIKDYKKRVGAFIKAIDARARRIEVIDKKIESIEERGLTAKNKRYHTAMHTEKLQIQERTKKLLEGFNAAQEKLKELGCEKNDDYKEEQKKRKKEKRLAEKANKLKQKSDGQTPSDLDHPEKADSRNVSKVDKLKEKKDVTKQDKLKEIKVVESLEPALELPSAKNFWTDNVESVSNALEEEESSSSEDESSEQPKKKRKKLTVSEKLAKARQDEERVRAMERAAIDSEAQPRSVDQFERSLLAHPASSQLWIAYMAFHLQATELDKARAVARKALNTIPFREEQEKLNVWIALINLEQRFGTKESQQKSVEEALQMNEPYRVHSALLDMCAETGNQDELTSLLHLVLRKYKRNPQIYIQAGSACFKLGLVDKARQVMQKAISILEKKEHVTVLVQFALLERGHGGRERAEALFEQVLAVYPQRVDVCAVYVDMLMKAGEVEQVRQVMDRMTSQKLPARKMKILYKKWIEIEEKCGDEAQIEKIRQRAMEFIEKAKF